MGRWRRWVWLGPFVLLLVLAPLARGEPAREARRAPAAFPAEPDWIAEGGQPHTWLGRSVGAGDWNGDGYSDLIVGAPRYDNGQTDEGGAFAYYGSADGLPPAPDWAVESDNAGAGFGVAVESAGDVNGDGYDDAVVGANLYDGGLTDQGAALLYYGSAAGLAAAPGWSVTGGQVNAQMGVFVDTAGDVNGDGYADVIVGARYYNGGGRAFVYHGGPAGLSPTPNWTADGSGEFGICVAALGDVNADGYGDVIVGAYRYSNGQSREGAVYAYYGSAAGLSPTPNWQVEGNASYANLGWMVATAGDVNGDGYDDAFVSATAGDGSGPGQAYLYYGSAAGLEPAPAWTMSGEQNGSRFGYSGGLAGDVDGDGYDDVVVGALFYGNGQSNEGKAYLYLGSAEGLSITPAWSAEGEQAGAILGDFAGRAGDVNGDGRADWVIGAPWYDNVHADEGRVYLYYGRGAAERCYWDSFDFGSDSWITGAPDESVLATFTYGGATYPALVALEYGAGRAVWAEGNTFSVIHNIINPYGPRHQLFLNAVAWAARDKPPAQARALITWGHREILTYHYGGQCCSSHIPQALTEAGYTVEMAFDLPASLDGYDVVVMPGVGWIWTLGYPNPPWWSGNSGHAPTADEIAALLAFVQSGGGLVTSVEWDLGAPWMNAIANPMGVTLAVISNASPLVGQRLVDHPIFEKPCAGPTPTPTPPTATPAPPSSTPAPPTATPAPPSSTPAPPTATPAPPTATPAPPSPTPTPPPGDAIAIDVKPGSCPNPVQRRDHGTLPVAVLGTAALDVTTIDPASVRLQGVVPLRYAYEDVSRPPIDPPDVCACTTDGPDGYLDLVLHFDVQAVLAALPGGAGAEVAELGSETPPSLGLQYDVFLPLVIRTPPGEQYVLTLTAASWSVARWTGQDCIIVLGNAIDAPAPNRAR